MGTISTNFGASDAYTVTVSWTESAQDTAKNQTTLAVTCTLRSNRASATFTGQARADTLTVAGQTYTYSHSAFAVPGGGSVTLWTASLAAAHDPDGTFSGKAVSFSVGIGTTFSSSGYVDAVSASGTMTLTAIPRASGCTFGAFTAGTAGNIAISAASAAFTHDVYIAFGTVSQCVAYNVAASASWTPALSLLEQIPNATSGSGTLTLYTYQNRGLVGSKAYAFTLYAPDSVRPSVTSFTAQAVSDNAVVSGWGVAVRTLSKLQWTAAAAGAGGSSVRSYAVSFGGVPGSGASGTTAAFGSAGTFTPTLTVTDSRGRTATAAAPAIAVLDYAAPSIGTASAVRCTADGAASDQGEYCKLTLTASCASVGGRNSLSLRYRTKTAAGSFSGWTALTSGTILPGFALDQSYTVELSAVDSVGSVRTVSVTVPAASAAFHLRSGGKGGAFGKYAETADLLDVAWNQRIRKNLTVDGTLTASGLTAESRRGWLGQLLSPAGNGTISNFNSGRGLEPGIWIVWNASGTAANGPYSKAVGGLCLVLVVYKSDGTPQMTDQLYFDGSGEVYYRQIYETTPKAWRQLSGAVTA